MKAKTFLVLPALFMSAWAQAQTTNAPPKPHVVEVPQPVQPSALPKAAASPTGQASPAAQASPEGNLDAAKVAEYQKRFLDGYALQQAGKLAEARAIYDGILVEQPQAKRSLLEAGRISFQLGELVRADEYLEKLREIVPDFPEAIELLIQINQALKHDVKVELLARDLRDLHDSGKVPEMKPYFVRERINLDQQVIIISQFFDYTQDPNTVYMAEVFDSTGLLQRRILLNYDAETTKALRAKDAKYQTAEVFTWLEHKVVNGKVTEIDAYLQIFALPEYNKFRSAMLGILVKPPKPIYSAPVDATQHQ
jgi:tetratricopeptide (TPR) repeat protein